LNKLKYLEKIEQRIEEDLDQFVNRRGDNSKNQKKGVHITKEMLLEASQCEKIDQISTVSTQNLNLIILVNFA
jgi:hypothetical protein